jgi:hypothetical protein
VRTLYYYTRYSRWPAVRERGEVPVDELATASDCPPDDAKGVRLAVELPNRWPSRKPVPVERCPKLWRNCWLFGHVACHGH